MKKLYLSVLLVLTSFAYSMEQGKRSRKPMFSESVASIIHNHDTALHSATPAQRIAITNQKALELAQLMIHRIVRREFQGLHAQVEQLDAKVEQLNGHLDEKIGELKK